MTPVAATVPIKQLSPLSREALVEHFLALAPEDYRLRFGRSMTPDAIREYVAAIDFDGDAVFGVFFRARPPASYAEVMQSDKEAFNRFFHAMLEEGVYLAPSAYEAGFVSAAHGEAEIADTLRAAERALAR